jgi:hypothetical protein
MLDAWNRVERHPDLTEECRRLAASTFSGQMKNRCCSCRMILIVGLAAAAIGLAGTPGASAAPANGAVINDLATTADHITPVRWWGRGYYHRRWGHGGHWRWGSRGWRRW